MKKITKTRPAETYDVYIAEDGTEFNWMPDCVKHDRMLEFERNIKKEICQIPIGRDYKITAKCVIETPEMVRLFTEREGLSKCTFNNCIETPVEVYLIECDDDWGETMWYDRECAVKFIDNELKVTEADIENIKYAKKLLS